MTETVDSQIKQRMAAGCLGKANEVTPEFRKFESYKNVCESCCQLSNLCGGTAYSIFVLTCQKYSRKYYAHKDDISAMVEWAEEWNIKEGGLVVCSNASDACISTCRHIPPHKHNSFDTTLCNRACHNSEAARCIAYRGNPEAKEPELVICSVADICDIKTCSKSEPHKPGPYVGFVCHASELAYNTRPYDAKAEAQKEEAPKEYVCLKKVDPLDIALTEGFSPTILKEMIRCSGWFTYYIGDEVKFCNHLSAEELEKYGFIEEAARDYIVSDGDWFTDGEGSFHILKNPDANIYDLINITGNDNYNYRSNEKPVMLSAIVGKLDLKHFKPCKVEMKITEVKD